MIQIDEHRTENGRRGIRRPFGISLTEVLLALAILAILALIGFHPLRCELDKGRMVSQISDLQKARDAVELFKADLGRFPETLDEAFPAGNAPWHLIYCREREDRNNGHGNQFCNFFDGGNPSGEDPPQSAPQAEYILSTQRDLCLCKDIDFVWLTCCGMEPRVVAPGEMGEPPGHPGGGGGNGPERVGG